MNDAPIRFRRGCGNLAIVRTHGSRAIEIQNGSRADSCPDGVVAYHAALSRLRPGFKSRSGRHISLDAPALTGVDFSCSSNMSFD